MSIENARVFKRAELKKDGKRLVAKARSGKIVLDNETSEFLSSINNNISLQDLARLSKKKIDDTLKKIIKLEELGLIELKLPCEDRNLQRLYEGPKRLINKICSEYRGMNNVTAYEKEWRLYPHALDFMDKKSENYNLKILEREIYLDIICPFLSRMPKGSDILDAGAGIGRFAIELIKMGHKVQLIDSSETALKKAMRHLLDKNLTDFDLHWGSVTNLAMFPDNKFDVVFAIELICYCDKPEKALKELARVTKKNGLIIISAEGRYGGMLSDPHIRLNNLSQIFKHNLLYIKNNLYVKYYTPGSLRRLLNKCGIECLNISGCHYIPDGVFHHLLNIDRLGQRDYKKRLFEIERLCREDEVLKNLARAWVAIGRKKANWR